MLLNKFKKIYSHRPLRPRKNRIGLISPGDGGTSVRERNTETILKSRPIDRPQLKICPSANQGGIVVN